MKKSKSKYESLFGKLDGQQWEENKDFAKKYDEGKYPASTDWALYFKNVAPQTPKPNQEDILNYFSALQNFKARF